MRAYVRAGRAIRSIIEVMINDNEVVWELWEL